MLLDSSYLLIKTDIADRLRRIVSIPASSEADNHELKERWISEIVKADIKNLKGKLEEVEGTRMSKTKDVLQERLDLKRIIDIFAQHKSPGRQAIAPSCYCFLNLDIII